MKAIVAPKYGPPEVLKLVDVQRPVPNDKEVLVKIFATTVVLGDCELRGFQFPQYGIGLRLLMRLGFGLRGPRKKILGQQLAGQIEKVGEKVSRFHEGDHVFGFTGLSLGTYAEYTVLAEDAVLTEKPASMTHEEASTIPLGGLEALYFLRKGKIQSGQEVLINGAGGSIGTIAVQLAKNHGAEVTAVDSAGKFGMLRDLGADHVIDYKTQDFTKMGETYDIIFDIVGLAPFQDSLKSLDEDGVYLLGNGTLSRSQKATARELDRIALDGPADYAVDDLVHLRNLIESEKLRAAIDKTFSLDQMVDAHRYVEAGGKLGNVVVTMVDS